MGSDIPGGENSAGRGIFYGWWVVCACFPIGLYASGIVFYGFTAFFQPFLNEFGWSYTEISFAASLRGVESGIFSPLIGFFVDRVGSRRLVLAGTLLTGLGLLLLSFTQSLVMFYFSFLLLAIGTSGCMGLVTMTAVAQWFEKDVGKAFGIMSSAFGASGLIIPLIVWLTDAFHWRTALIILAVGMWAMGIPLSFVIRERPERRDSADGTGRSNISVSRNKDQPPKADMPVKEALRNRAFIWLVLVEMVRAMILLGVVTHVMPYLAHTGMSRPRAGLVAAAIPLTSILGRFGLGWFADVFSKKYIMALAYCFMGLGLFAFCFVEAGWAILFFLFFFSTGLGGSMVLRGAILKEYFGSGSFGRLLGILMGSGALGGIVGPTATGWIFDTLGDYRLAWFGFLGPLVVSIFLILSLDPRKIKSTRMPSP